MLVLLIKKVDYFMLLMYGIEHHLIYQQIYVRSLIFIKQLDLQQVCEYVGCLKMILIENYGQKNLK
jgi:hypothetical protein